jgi:hypothetical protein
MYVPRTMLMCNRVTLEEAGAFSDWPAAVAALVHSLVARITIKTLNAHLVWSARGQSERK